MAAAQVSGLRDGGGGGQTGVLWDNGGLSFNFFILGFAIPLSVPFVFGNYGNMLLSVCGLV